MKRGMSSVERGARSVQARHAPRFTLHALRFTLFALLLTACGQETAGPTTPAGDVIFSEDFTLGEANGWQTESDDFGYTAVVNEQLVIELNSANVLQYATLEQPIFDDFDLQVDVTQLAGPAEGSYGLLFRMASPGQFYRFDLTGNGLYIVERRNGDGTWTRLVNDWIPSAAIQQGLNVTNRLRVSAVGPNLTFYINDQLVQQINDQTHLSGQLALDAGTFGQPGLQVAFDNLIVRQP
jgi:hypothetical protein